jgi:hypothetical protein
MHGPEYGAAGEEIDAPATELPRARARQYESACSFRLRVDELMDDGQQFGHALDFIEHDVGSLRTAEHEFAQSFGPGLKLSEDLGTKEVNEERAGKLAFEPSRLACPPRTEEEGTLSGNREKSP